MILGMWSLYACTWWHWQRMCLSSKRGQEFRPEMVKWKNAPTSGVCNFVGPTNFQLLLHGFKIVLDLSVLKSMADPHTNKTNTQASHLNFYLGAVNLNCRLREMLNGIPWTLRSLSFGRCNWIFNEGKVLWRKITRGSSMLNISHDEMCLW